MIKEGTLEHQEWRKNMVRKNTGKKIGFPSPLEFSKFCLMVEAKIITLPDMVLNVNIENI